jgi:hypothetical protein
MRQHNTTLFERGEDRLSGICPYCLLEVDVNFDIKRRPYWRCGHCDLRVFASRTSLIPLQRAGWIQEGEPTAEVLLEFLDRVAEAAGVRIKIEKRVARD